MDFQAVKRRLLQEKNQIEDRIQNSGSYGLDDAMSDELSELSLYDNHPADVASELFEREKDLGMKMADKVRLKQIEGAMDAIEQGTYGICVHCGKSISDERLVANPTTRMCISCKRLDEKIHPNRNRPIEEDFLYPGFARTNLDDTENVGFDGEDSWQAVDRYNERSTEETVYEHDEWLDDHSGIVDQMDAYSNEYDKNQIP